MMLLLVVAMIPVSTDAVKVNIRQTTGRESEKAEAKPIRKVLFLGDSMTGWLSERLNAYGEKNGFEVATVVWDGSTIKKWGSTSRLSEIIASHKPDAVFISLGLNELFASNPQNTLGAYTDNILSAVGNIPLLWIGPPSWPGHAKGEKMDSWLASKMGEGRYFSSFNMSLPRQSNTNPHPTKEGCAEWIDEVVEWIPSNTQLHFESLK
ncbi:MAG: SGNH/GDSL hydrolase family protein, partial [Muribaculaceae bacterium]|nr:SGNH/GDSL hydrolase family protein [Muribaculaceae bacterium]